MPVIDLVNLRAARKDLDELADWLANSPNCEIRDLHSLDLAIALIDDEIRRFERRIDELRPSYTS